MAQAPEVYDWDDPEMTGGASSSRGSWRNPAQNREEHGNAGWDESDASSDDFDNPVPPLEASQQLLDYLLWSNQRGHMTARQVCTVAFWASKAGATALEVLAVNPRSTGGNFQKKVDTYMASTLGSQRDATYVAPVPAQIHSTGCRDIFDLHTMPPHEVLSTAHAQERAGMVEELRKASASSQLPKAYTEHPVVQRAPEDAIVLPLAMFLDGVRFGRKGSVLGVTIQRILPGSRKYLCIALRKKLTCLCGCRKWCTLYPLFKMIRWSLEALADGKWPAKNHLEEDWDVKKPADKWRHDKAGTPLPFRGALCQVRSDWSELATHAWFPELVIRISTVFFVCSDSAWNGTATNRTKDDTVPLVLEKLGHILPGM